MRPVVHASLCLCIPITKMVAMAAMNRWLLGTAWVHCYFLLIPPSLVKVPQGSSDVTPDIISYYHPNITVNLVDDHTQWVKGSVPQPMDKCKGGEEERREGRREEGRRGGRRGEGRGAGEEGDGGKQEGKKEV